MQLSPAALLPTIRRQPTKLYQIINHFKLLSNGCLGNPKCPFPESLQNGSRNRGRDSEMAVMILGPKPGALVRPR
jgi:hypothetical protein